NYDSLDELPDGAEISLPVDTANNGRGIKLLAERGLLEIDESVPVTELSQADIVSNPRTWNLLRSTSSQPRTHWAMSMPDSPSPAWSQKPGTTSKTPHWYSKRMKKCAIHTPMWSQSSRASKSQRKPKHSKRPISPRRCRNGLRTKIGRASCRE